MSAYLNANENNALAALAARAPARVVSAIQHASARTGVDFAYLMEKAAAESNFDPAVKSPTSSATGLYQFIESTWLQMVRDHGAKYGLGQMAAQIDDRGRVSDPAVRKQILDLRKDPEKAACLAAEFASDNKTYLERTWGGEVGSTELYFAHFLGAGGAAGFLKARDEEPMTIAADLFPKAAQANRNVFYDSRTGRARTLAEVYDFFDRKFQAGSDPVRVASADLRQEGRLAPLPPRKAVAQAAYRMAPVSAEATAPFRPYDRDRADTGNSSAALQDAAFGFGAASIGGMAGLSSGGLAVGRPLVPMELILLARLQEGKGV